MFNGSVMAEEYAKYSFKYSCNKGVSIEFEYYSTKWVLTQGKPRREIDSNNFTSVRTLGMVDSQRSRNGV
jgi:hypothetical protein